MIKKIIIICVLIFGVLNCMSDAQEIFFRANKYYQSKQYEKALDLYNTIACKGCATWYNMGNCAFRLNRQVDALVFWRRAQRSASAREFDELQRNIDTVYEILGKGSERGGGVSRFANNLLGRFSLLFLQLSLLIVWFSLFLFIWLTKRFKKGVLIILIPLNLFLGIATFMKYRFRWNPPAVVVKGSATLFAGPDQNYHVMGTVHLADEIEVIEKRGDWYKVCGNNLAGWVLADTLEIV